MFVKEKMTIDVATVRPSDSISYAFQILKERSHSQLPVIDNSGKLIGLITEKLLAEVSPSKATSLSVYEINYLLSKTKVQDVMKTEIFTTMPNILIEDAALLMINKDIGSLPVVDEAKKLVGIVTRLDIFKAFVDIMGVNDFGTRIVLKVPDNVGTLAEISSILKQYDINITHISTYDNNNGATLITIKMNTSDKSKITEVQQALKNHSYEILNVSVNTHE